MQKADGMNPFRTAVQAFAIGLFAFTGTLLAGAACWAADGSADWRPTYDLALRWLNFLLLVFILVKYARKPLITFLKGKQEEIGDTIGQFEQKREAIEQSLQKARQALEESARRKQKLEESIVSQGQRRKRQIVREAKEESRRIIDNAKGKIAGEIITARQTIREEIVDTAIQNALVNLPGKINRADHQNYIEMFLSGTTDK